MSSHDSVDRIDRKILQFWIDNPANKGTPRVIADWWLPRNGEAITEAQVRETLNRLSLRGWIVERGTSPGSKVYGLNLLKIHEIKEFLETPEIETAEHESAPDEMGLKFSLQDLKPALQRLDRLIREAVRRLGDTQGPNALSDAFRGLHISPEEVEQLLERPTGSPTLASKEESIAEGDDAADDSPQMSWLEGAYGLSPIEKDIVLVALAPELDLKYERLYAYLQDDVSKKRPTIDLTLNLLTDSGDAKLVARKSFAPEAALLRQALIHLITDPHQTQPPLLAHYIKLDEQIINLLLGQNTQDPRLNSLMTVIPPSVNCPSSPIKEEIYFSLHELIREARQTNSRLLLYCKGEQGSGQQETMRAIACEAVVPLVEVDAWTLRLEKHDIGKTIQRLSREAWFKDGILFLKELDVLRTEEHVATFHRMMDALDNSAGITVMSGTLPWRTEGHGPDDVLTIPFDIPGFEQRRVLWQVQIKEQCVDLKLTDLTVGDIDVLADRFQLTPDEITESVAAAKQVALWRRIQDPTQYVKEGLRPMQGVPCAKDFYTAARNQCGHELLALAQKITPIHSWADLVLSADAMSQLHEICEHVTHRRQVLDDWGFREKLSLGRGLSVLFSGPSGTGKTSAAEIIANELHQDLYKIDLSRVVSKYIGETEKNLDQVFRAAHRSNAILFFDEADALWGKRSEVKHSHDRYANLEIAYLLQKMDEYEGIAILATNLRTNMDEAFIRRLQFIVEFPFPTEMERRNIWKLLLEPKEDRERRHKRRQLEPRDIGFDWLARNVRVAGGNIKNIVLAAAYLAAAEKQETPHIRMKHLLHAIRREYHKMGIDLPESELAAYEKQLAQSDSEVKTGSD
jgi:AAA+ superfamily predicted ATPase